MTPSSKQNSSNSNDTVTALKAIHSSLLSSNISRTLLQHDNKVNKAALDNIISSISSVQQALISIKDFDMDKWKLVYECRALHAFISALIVLDEANNSPFSNSDWWIEFDRSFGQLAPQYFRTESSKNDSSSQADRIIGLALLRHLLTGDRSSYYMLLARITSTFNAETSLNCGPGVTFAKKLQESMDEGKLKNSDYDTNGQSSAFNIPSFEYSLALIVLRDLLVSHVMAQALEKSLYCGNSERIADDSMNDDELRPTLFVYLPIEKVSKILEGIGSEQVIRIANERGWQVKQSSASVLIGVPCYQHRDDQSSSVILSNSSSSVNLIGKQIVKASLEHARQLSTMLA